MIEPVYQQNVNVKTSAINRIMKTLEYYSSDGTHTVFKNYAIDEAGVIEKEHESVSAAVRYLKGNDHLKASTAAIGSALRKGSVSYGRTWKLVVD